MAHPQTKGLAEVTNRTILKGLKKCLEEGKGNWVEKLPSVLWAYRTAPRKGIGELPFCFSSKRNVEFNAFENDRLMREDLLFQDRVKNAIVQWDELYKRVAVWYHNAWIRPSGIQAGDWVLRKNQISGKKPN